MTILSDEQLAIIRFCAIECELQCSGERSVYHMVQAWAHAQECSQRPTAIEPSEEDILTLGLLVEPGNNQRGYRQRPVWVGLDAKLDWQLIPRQMTNLINAIVDLKPAEWFRAYEEIHPFIDGNGRTGIILFEWLNNTLTNPIWPPNFWNDPRRLPGAGAPL